MSLPQCSPLDLARRSSRSARRALHDPHRGARPGRKRQRGLAGSGRSAGGLARPIPVGSGTWPGTADRTRRVSEPRRSANAPAKSASVVASQGRRYPSRRSSRRCHLRGATASSGKPITDAGPPMVEPEVAEPAYVYRRAICNARDVDAPSVTSSTASTRPFHLHRPHLHHKRAPGRRGCAARVGLLALLTLTIVLGALAVGAVLLSRHSERPKIPPPPKIVKIVIPEGFTRAQIAALAHQDGLSGSYLSPSKRSSEIDLSHYGAPVGTPNLEGFLFPASYEMYVGAPASQLVSEQLTAFHENFGGGEVHRANVLGITPYQLLIVASIIEREAAIPHDRPLVAAVIYNRLRLNMTLGIDSTLRYALNDFSPPLTEVELHSDSPYNTRTHAACRRRRSPIQASPPSRPRLIPRTSPTCITSPAPTAAARRSSRRAIHSLKRTLPPTARQSAKTVGTCPVARSDKRCTASPQ